MLSVNTVEIFWSDICFNIGGKITKYYRRTDFQKSFYLVSFLNINISMHICNYI